MYRIVPKGIQRRLRRAHRLIASAVLVAAISAPAFPQEPARAVRTDISPPSATVRINPSTIRINRRNPIPFKPFEMLDPETGKPVSRETPLPLLPNGKVLTAGQYYDEINRLEKQFNALGYSLRDNSEQAIKLAESTIPRAKLDTQVRKLRAAELPNVKPQALSLQAAEQQLRAIPQIQQEKLLKLYVPKPLNLPNKNVKYNLYRGENLGDPNVFAAYYSAKLGLLGSYNIFGSSVNLTAEAKAGGSVFNKDFEIVRVTGNLSSAYSPATKKNSMSLKLGAYVLGYSLYSLNKATETLYLKSDSLSKTVDSNVKIYFTLGPIPMSGNIGFQGEAGTAYCVMAGNVTVGGWVGPKVKTKVYGQVGADIAVAGAGVGGDLVLLDYWPMLAGDIRLNVDSSNKPYFKTSAEFYNNLEALSGNFYVYVYVYYPCLKFPKPWCKKEWRWTIWDWEGVKTHATLLKFGKTDYI